MGDVYTQACVLKACIAVALPVACVCQYHAANRQKASNLRASLYVEKSQQARIDQVV